MLIGRYFELVLLEGEVVVVLVLNPISPNFTGNIAHFFPKNLVRMVDNPEHSRFTDLIADCLNFGVGLFLFSFFPFVFLSPLSPFNL